MPEPREKIPLLQINELRMDEVVVFEKLADCTVRDAYNRASDGDTPSGVLMALAYLTEKRVNSGTSKAKWRSMSFTEFMVALEERFTFETYEDASDEPAAEEGADGGTEAGEKTEDPTPAG